jgi:ATP-dependent DNA ligase
MPLGRAREPFPHPEWIYEVKWDGFRAVAYVYNGECRLISRNGNAFKSFPALAENLPAGAANELDQDSQPPVFAVGEA